MFKPSKKTSFKAKEKVNFKLEFHASRIPQRGWDKLLVSLISVETSKVTARTGKVPIKNGACQWSEPLYESAFLSQEPNGKDANKELYKLVVSMGLSRLGILGEATINLGDYVQALMPVSLSLPLQNCNFGSILHVKVQRIMPKSASRDFKDQKEVSYVKDSQPSLFEGSQQSELESYQQINTGKPAIADKDDSAPLSTPRYSTDSVDVPPTPGVSESRMCSREGMGEELTSPSSSVGSCSGRQESGNSFHDYIGFSRADLNQGFTDEITSPGANANLSFAPYHSKKSHNGNDNQNDQFNPNESLIRGSVKTKELEAAEATIKELRLEAALWEQQGKQLGVEMEALKKQVLEETKRNEELQRTLSALVDERENLKHMEKAHVKAEEGLDWRELQDELEYEKSVNSNLTLQLRKTQESNSELLLEIKDLERSLHDNNESEKLPNQVSVSGIRVPESTEEDLKKMVDALKEELEELERDSQELTEENMDLISQLKQANDKLNAKESTILQLEMKITNEMNTHAETEAEKLREMVDEMREKLRDCEESFEIKLASSRTLIDDLNSSVMMLRSKNTRLERELQSSEEHTSELLKEIESLKMENDAHEWEKSLFVSQKGQLKGLRDKASKAEQEYMNAVKRMEELEAMNRELKEEKSGDITALKKQLEDSQEHVLALDSKYKDVLQVISHMRAEKLDLEKDMSTLLEAKEEAEATMAQLQSFNVVLQEKLDLEQLKTSELLQQCEESEAKSSQLLEEMKVNQTQVKTLKQAVTELETLEKEMESKVHGLQEENRLCKSQTKGLELHIAALEEETLSLKASRSASEVKSQNLQVLNDELSEKLKNAREDIEWARENTNTLVNEIRELEGEIESDNLVRSRLEQLVSELEVQKENLQSQVVNFSDKIVQLEKEIMDFEGRYEDVMHEKCALVLSIREQESAHKDLEASLQTVIKQQKDRIQQFSDKSVQLEKEVMDFEGRFKDLMHEKGALVVSIREQESACKVSEASFHAVIKQQQDRIQQLLASDGENKEKQALPEASVHRAEKTDLEEKLGKLQEMLKQAKEDATSSEKKEKQALLEALVLKTEKTELEEKLWKLQEMLKQDKKDALSLKENLECKVHEAMVKELDMMKKLDEAVREAELLKYEKLNYSQKIMEFEEKCAIVELEKEEMSAQLSEIRSRTGECELWQREKEEAEKALAILKQEKGKLEASLENAVQEISTLKERPKVTMEEKISHFQEANEKEKNSELSKLKKQISELECKLSEQEVEREDLNKRVFSLEEELQCKASALALAEKKLKDREASANGGSPVSLLPKSLSRANSRVGPMSTVPLTCEAKESADLQEKVRLLEGEVKRKAAELEASKQQLKEQHTQFSIKMEHLELANEQLVKENQNSNVDQILKELNSLQNQNEALYQREIELLFKLSSQGALQRELDNVKEEKKELELALSKFSAAASGENFLKRISTLEMELTEVLEANNMYKVQLQSAFAKQHNVHAAALENLGSVEQVIQDLAELKRKNLILDDELRDMRERYFNMSLQFAEVEAEREELVMTIRTLRGVKKLTPYRSANF